MLQDQYFQLKHFIEIAQKSSQARPFITTWPFINNNEKRDPNKLFPLSTQAEPITAWGACQGTQGAANRTLLNVAKNLYWHCGIFRGPGCSKGG